MGFVHKHEAVCDQCGKKAPLRDNDLIGAGGISLNPPDRWQSPVGWVVVQFWAMDVLGAPPNEHAFCSMTCMSRWATPKGTPEHHSHPCSWEREAAAWEKSVADLSMEREGLKSRNTFLQDRVRYLEGKYRSGGG